MKVLGINPFGWRFPTALLGALLPFLVFFLAREMFSNRSVSFAACAFSVLDFARIGISRVANVDTQLVFWLMLGYFFLFRFVRYRSEAGPSTPMGLRRREVAVLVAACFAFGTAMATKWIGVFALGAVAVTLVSTVVLDLIRRAPEGRIPELLSRQNLRRLGGRLGLGLLVCLSLLLATYLSTYVPLLRDEGLGVGLGKILAHQVSMLTVHSQAVDFHPYRSAFLVWPLVDFPMAMHVQRGLSSDQVGVIFCFGNPVVYWAMLPALGFLVLRQKPSTNPAVAFLLLGFCFQYFPWMFVNRFLFNYHFLSASMFAIIAVAYAVFGVASPRFRFGKWVFLGSATVVFLAYWPMFTGVTVSARYIEHLRLFDNWFLPFDWPDEFRLM